MSWGQSSLLTAFSVSSSVQSWRRFRKNKFRKWKSNSWSNRKQVQTVPSRERKQLINIHEKLLLLQHRRSDSTSSTLQLHLWLHLYKLMLCSHISHRFYWPCSSCQRQQTCEAELCCHDNKHLETHVEWSSWWSTETEKAADWLHTLNLLQLVQRAETSTHTTCYYDMLGWLEKICSHIQIHFHWKNPIWTHKSWEWCWTHTPVADTTRCGQVSAGVELLVSPEQRSNSFVFFKWSNQIKSSWNVERFLTLEDLITKVCVLQEIQ